VSVFVGRAEELANLAAIAAAGQGGPSAALILGDPGSGKSRLLSEAANRLGLESLRIVGYEAERQVPLGAAADLLRRLAGTLAFEADASSPLEPIRIFEAAHRALRSVEPALLLVDDVQWVDELSLALCHYLVRAAEASEHDLTLIAAARPSAQASAFAESLAHVVPEERRTTVELGPLSAEEALELVRGLAPSLDASAATQLAAKAGGWPFWLEALVRTGGPAADAGQLVTARLRGAGADAGALLALLAVAARPLAPADVSRLEDWSRERVEHAASELVNRGVALRSTGTIRLAHDLIREAALKDVADEQQRELHGRIARWLEDGAENDLQRLRAALEHRHAAGLPAFVVAARLARSPQRTLLGPEGMRMLAAIGDEGDPFDAAVLTLHEDVAGLATELAEHEEALARWSLVAERSEDGMRRASALLAATRAAYELGRIPEAREALAQSERIDEIDDVVRLEQRSLEAAILLWLEQRMAEGRAIADEALAAAGRLASERGGVSALDERARRAYLEALRLEYEAAVIEGDPEALLRVAELRETAARGLDVESYLTASIALGFPLRQNGRIHEAIGRYRRVWEEAHRRVLPRLLVDAGYWLARTLELTGELVEAEEVAREASDVAARAGEVPRARHRISRVAIGIALQRGRPAEGLRVLETTEEPNEHQRIMLHGDLALWHGRVDGPAAAPTVVAQLARGQACADAVGCERCAAELLLFAAEGLARAGEPEAARQALARWEATGIRPEIYDEILYLHAAALAEMDTTARIDALQTALTTAEGSPYRLAALWIRLDLGRALAAADTELAVTELEQVVDLASRQGATTVVELAEQALRALGVRTWRRGPAAPLTERELQIARLISAGASNPEIARELFLSRKTVERHVSNLLRKVGVRNRAELAARVPELEVEGAPR
jgi:DNA-binding CsgD family transcriptional regulator